MLRDVLLAPQKQKSLENLLETEPGAFSCHKHKQLSDLLTWTDNVACCSKAPITVSTSNKMIMSINGIRNVENEPRTWSDYTEIWIKWIREASWQIKQCQVKSWLWLSDYRKIGFGLFIMKFAVLRCQKCLDAVDVWRLQTTGLWFIEVFFFLSCSKAKWREVRTTGPCMTSIPCAPLTYTDLAIEQKWQMPQVAGKKN